ncbi:hypothetical protein A2U01_0057629, partial [Trifolium medium]|nr:hypothetical protein [Trifolium medium]
MQSERSQSFDYDRTVQILTLGGQPPDCSKENVTTGLQHHSNGESSVSTGLAIENPPDNDK